MNRLSRQMMLATIALAFAAPHVAFAAAPEPITVSYSTTSDFAPTFIAKDAGIFSRHGLDVTLTNLATTALGPPALQSGSMQIASSSPPLLILANDGGMDLVAVAGVASLDARKPKSALITRPGFQASKAQDFIGKKIARPGINSAIDLVLKKWLIDNHVGLDQVTLVETPFPQMGDLLRAGQIDAAVELEPLLTRIVSSGAGEKSVDFFSQVNPHIVAAVYASSREWAKAHGETLKAFRESLIEAARYQKDHPDEAAAIQRKYVGGASAPSELELDLAAADFDFWVSVLRQLKLIQQQPDAAKLIMP